ncbi:hypothetical protein PSQ19_08465 [Devosia algicola]|uniref:Uncharacterized protein n=1 Tax=Devosia algicola TaxID=3026418 RepID=A0ABY7YST3_9HYPH|nr:hypothetical protein [Devosia algicola]WDR04029.1 hypothetical protein PSQ19_08465 [Devosia algicola]
MKTVKPSSSLSFPGGALLDGFAGLDAAAGQGPEVLIGSEGALNQQNLVEPDQGDTGGAGNG